MDMRKDKVERNKYSRLYTEKNYKRYSFFIPRKEEEIIKLLDSKARKTDYIKSLIRKDMGLES